MELSEEFMIEWSHKIDLVNAQIELTVEHIVELQSGEGGFTERFKSLSAALNNRKLNWLFIELIVNKLTKFLRTGLSLNFLRQRLMMPLRFQKAAQ